MCACTCVLHSFMCYCCCCCWFSCRFMAPVVEHQTKRPPLKSMLHFSHLPPLHRVYAAYSACQLCGSGKRIAFACLQLIACDSLLNFRFVEFLNFFNFEKVFFFSGNEFSLRLSIPFVFLSSYFSLARAQLFCNFQAAQKYSFNSFIFTSTVHSLWHFCTSHAFFLSSFGSQFNSFHTFSRQ